MFADNFELSASYIPRGIKNNNPGNIRISSVTWIGKIPKEKNTDGSFEQFVSMDYGVRALIKNLTSYINGGTNTIRKILNKYAPSSENDTKAYINNMVKYTGIPADKVLQPTEDNLTKIARVITGVENGFSNMLSMEQIKKGYDLAGITGLVKQKLLSKEGMIFLGVMGTLGVATWVFQTQK